MVPAQEGFCFRSRPGRTQCAPLLRSADWLGRWSGVAYFETGSMSAWRSLVSSTSSSCSRIRVGTTGTSCVLCCRLVLSGVVDALAIDIEVLDLWLRSGVGGILDPRPGRSMLSSSPYSLPWVETARPVDD